MKNIKLYMRDNLYSENLCKLLNSYDDINCSIVENYDTNDNSYIYITDFFVKDIKNVINLITDTEKYQNVDNIYDMIIKKYSLINIFSEKLRIITFVNICENRSHNILALEIYKEFNKRYNSLLVNCNYFYDYDMVENEIGLESLLFVDDNCGDVTVNNSKNINYIGASSMPIETNKHDNIKKILKTLKNMNYDFTIIDLSFILTQRNLEILKNSDIIIYYFPINSDEIFISKNIQNINNFLNTSNNTKKTIEIRPTKSGYSMNFNNEIIEINSLSKVVELL